MEYPPLVTTTVTNPTNTTNNAMTTMSPTAMVPPDYTAALLELKNKINLLKTTMQPSSTPPTTVDYAAELVSLKKELQSLHTLITTAVEQLKTDIASLHAAPMSSDMDMDGENHMENNLDIMELIAELKHDIANIALEMRAKFQQQATLKSTTNPKSTPKT